jgi:glycerol-3-phosphate dehydrogenase
MLFCWPADGWRDRLAPLHDGGNRREEDNANNILADPGFERRVSVHDLAVVGGGIVGLGVARLAARNGLSVAVVERSDLASGASGASSHMLHGGLRYLEHGHLSLVREALRERLQVSRMAPDLTRPVRFMVPSYRGDRRPRWMVRVGLALYDMLAGERALSPHRSTSARDTAALEPDLSPAGLTGAGIYSDVVMDDGRLAVTVAMDAARHGAAIHTWTEAAGARPEPDGTLTLIARDRIENRELRIRARVIVNATGAWADRVRRDLLCALRPGAADPMPLLRPSRGVHLVFPSLTRGHGITSFAPDDGRVVFVVPFDNYSLVGTTEVEVDRPLAPDAWHPTAAEVRYLRGVVRRLLPSHADVPAIAVTSGLRPLLAAPQGGVGSAPREHRVVEDGALLTIVGGKYTTFRVMARDVLTRAWERLGRASTPLRDPVEPLPAWPVGLATPEAIADFAAAHAFARRTEDVVRRRSQLWLAPDRGRITAPIVAAVLAHRFGWDAARVDVELRHFHTRLDREERVMAEAGENR